MYRLTDTDIESRSGISQNIVVLIINTIACIHSDVIYYYIFTITITNNKPDGGKYNKKTATT